ncbi:MULTISPECIES: protoporphyrinogen oxidase [unclassified Niallia]|uniref:protoporphyrinogen oxidase n=1 Tax=unclassified Niallia TaxID=2837522 RepID=UPI001ED9F090|nr:MULTISPECIES: protoporphyrinogen oxidase [unclassified Niallia]MDL0436017.1 protoporphyrinogen oxidase [Niallia sp. SS-2023]UPO87883.1 protoporphyrinogen oxidase [Niallia sp. Man26]
MKTIVVVGGGITGLSAMYYLQKLTREHKLDIKLILIEGEVSLGGKIHSIHKGDFIMETGADSIVARNKNVLPFVQELGLEEELVYNATGISYIHTRDKLLEIPKDSVFGIPMTLESLLSSELISQKGKLEALKDLLRTNKHFTKETSIGEFLEYFLGKEIVEKQITPVLAGVYSGGLYNLTMASTLPYLLEYKEKYGSIIRGLGKNKSQFQSASNKKFISFQNGLSTIINRLEEVLEDVEFKKGKAVESIKKEQDGYSISLAEGEAVQAQFIVLAAPHQAAEKILAESSLSTEFARLQNSSNITMYLAYDIPDEQLPKDGTGFIVAEDSDLTCNACTWTSRKWTHTSKSSSLLLRLFYKKSNPAYEQLNSLSEEELLKVAKKDIEKSLGITEKPISYEVTKWNELMPVYSLQHKSAIDTINAKMAELFPNVLLAGSSYYGVGIAACIANGEETAGKLTKSLL